MSSIVDLQDCVDASLVGGKAASLGRLLRAGFVVPAGFVVTTGVGEVTTETIREAYRNLGSPTMAVRSSATVEDHRDASMAGQFKTVLNVQSESGLVDAIEICRASAQSSRVRAYSEAREHPLKEIEMAVLAQRQVAPDLTGVLFTRDPRRPAEMLIEATRGTGERLVSGRVQPDAFRIDTSTGKVIETIASGVSPCLTIAEIEKIWKLGRDIAAHVGSPQDVEWAIAGGELFVLQARPITGRESDEFREALITEARNRLIQSRHGPWVIHNLAETLSHPTPLTWSVLRRFMSGTGGFASMYRRLGFEPDCDEFVKLILGKIYLDLARAPKLFGKHFPFQYDADGVRRDPSLAELPPTCGCGSWFDRLRATRRMTQARKRIEIEATDFDQRLNNQIIPEFVAMCRREKERDLAVLSVAEWIDVWRQRERCLFDEFVPEILFTNFIAGVSLTGLRNFLAEILWNDDGGTVAQGLASAGPPNRTVMADAELREVAEDKRTIETWLQEHGHRGIGEFELANPRWREIPEQLAAFAGQLKNGRDPLALHNEHCREADAVVSQLSPDLARKLGPRLALVRRYLAFRENGKHFVMLGYDLLRDMALDASRRLNADVFYLTFDELAEALQAGSVSQTAIARRKREHRAMMRICLPQFISADTLPFLGQPPKIEDQDHVRGRPISAGLGSGPARVVESPLGRGNLGTGYVLVCSSADPEWTPLFVNAAALVLECGGSLSHGAIVARELGIPAVVLEEATRMFRDGQQLFVDGSLGIVARNPVRERSFAQDLSIAAEDKPPAIGAREKSAVRLRNVSVALWGVYLASLWALPRSWIYQPSLHALDQLLWPIVRAVGRPATVGIVAAGVAVIAAVVQKLCIDNARLSEGQRRVRRLREQLRSLPPESSRAGAIRAIDKSFRARLTSASFVWVGILLGVLIMTFAWLRERIERPSPGPGSAARIVATVDSDFREPVMLVVSPPLRLDEASEVSRTLPPIRETLEQLASQKTTSTADAADIHCYLRSGLPPQTLTWIVRSEAAGSFPVNLILEKKTLVRQLVVYGEQSPPPDPQTIHDEKCPLRTVRVESASPQNSGVATSWSWIYLACYLPTWMLLRRILRLA